MPGSMLNAKPRRERLAVAGDEVRLLVALEPDPVPEPVEERIAVAAAAMITRGDVVQVAAGDPGRTAAWLAALRLANELEDRPELVGPAAARVAAGHPQRPGDVGAVAVERCRRCRARSGRRAG